MKLAKIIDPKFKDVIRKLAAEKLPLKTAFKIKGIMKTLDGEIEKYDEVRREALDKYGSRGEDGELVVDATGGVQLDAASMAMFMKSVNELLGMQVAVDTISISELGDDVRLSADDLTALDDLLIG